MCAATDDDRLKRALFRSVLNCCATEPVTWSVASVPCQRSVRTFRDCNDGTEPEPCGLAKSPGSEEKSYGSEGSEEKSRVSEENCFYYLVFVQTSFGSLDLGSSQKKMGNRHGPQQKRQLQFFPQRNSIDAVYESFEFRLSITPAYFIPVGITM